MFNLTTLELKLAGIAILLLGIGSFIYMYHHRGVEIDTLKKTTVVQQIANTELQKTIKEDTALSDVNNTVQTNFSKNITTVQKIHDDVVSKVEKQIVTIDDDFHKNPAPKTQAQIDANETATSIVLINGLWEQYCSNLPTDIECNKPS